MSNPEVYAGERSADKRTGWFAILLLNVLVVTTFQLESGLAPGFILTTQDGMKIHANALQSIKLSRDYDNEKKGFDVQSPNGITRIPYDLNGIRKMEILSFKNSKPEPTPTLRPWTLPSPITSPSVLNSQTPKRDSLGDEFEVNVKIESESGEFIEGFAMIKGRSFQPPDSLPYSFKVWTDKGGIEEKVLDIKSIEREPSVLYEWSKRLF